MNKGTVAVNKPTIPDPQVWADTLGRYDRGTEQVPAAGHAAQAADELQMTPTDVPNNAESPVFTFDAGQPGKSSPR